MPPAIGSPGPAAGPSAAGRTLPARLFLSAGLAGRLRGLRGGGKGGEWRPESGLGMGPRGVTPRRVHSCHWGGPFSGTSVATRCLP